MRQPCVQQEEQPHNALASAHAAARPLTVTVLRLKLVQRLVHAPVALRLLAHLQGTSRAGQQSQMGGAAGSAYQQSKSRA